MAIEKYPITKKISLKKPFFKDQVFWISIVQIIKYNNTKLWTEKSSFSYTLSNFLSHAKGL